MVLNINFFKLKSHDQITRIAFEFLKVLNVRFLKNDVEAKILEHPSYPSLISIIDTFESYGINSYPIKTEINEIQEISEPFIAHTYTQDEDHFMIVSSINQNEVSIIEDTGRNKKITLNQFEKIWTGIALFAEHEHSKTSTKIQDSLKHKSVNRILIILSVVLFLFTTPSWINTAPVYLVAKIIGFAVSIILIWYEIDRFNPVLKNICSIGTKINCNRVISSRGAKVFKTFSLSEISFSYFAGSLLFLVLNGLLVDNIQLLSLISLFTIPLLIYSLYYQSIVLKQWCFLCLIIGVSLFVEIIYSIKNFTTLLEVSFNSILILAFSLIIPLIAWRLLFPVFVKAKEYPYLKIKHSHFKANPDVFFGLLNASSIIETPNKKLGIRIGNEDAPYDVIKVCNPFCPPCALAHPILDELIENGKISLQIIFTIPYDIDHSRITPARHLLFIAENYDAEYLKSALDDWYLADKKDYSSFAVKHPTNLENLDKQTPNIQAMKIWCQNHNITQTPTIFLNNKKLPSGYSAYDLRNIL